MGWKDQVREVAKYLRCSQCGITFHGSFSQGKKVYYEELDVYCSSICRKASHQEKLGIVRGPCPTCGQTFRSNYRKIFCSMDCYTMSSYFKKVQEEAREKSKSQESRKKLSETLRKGEYLPCLECGEYVYSKPSEQRKFCSKTCYRSFMAKRFDRWAANPKSIDIIQCYDEFLDQDVLECPVEDCSWKGSFLSVHMNLYHGVKAEEFKRAAGFNLTTGVVSKPVRQALEERNLTGVAINPVCSLTTSGSNNPSDYISRERIEHHAKSRALFSGVEGPHRVCVWCGNTFKQSTPFGRTKYCSVECRENLYKKQKHRKAKIRKRDKKGRFLWVTSSKSQSKEQA